MDELERSIPGAEGMADAEETTKKRSHNETCLNCGTPLLDNFCHHCGQKDIPRRQTLGELWKNFISSFWSYEGKFFRTTKFLITKPAFLAIEYNAGRRESYYHPARMYAFISFVFFLVFFSLPDKPDEKESLEKSDKTEQLDDDNNQKSLEQEDLDSLVSDIPGTGRNLSKIIKDRVDSVQQAQKAKNKKKNVQFSIAGEEYTDLNDYDSTQLAMPESKRDGWFRKMVVVKVIALKDRYGDNEESFGKEFVKAFMENFSKVLFFLLPVFALILKLLYIRRDYYYSEHLVFSIYYYNFFYLAGSVQMLVNRIPILDWVGSLIGFWIFFYLLFAMKRMYQQSWKKTTFKFFIFSFLFLICAGVGLAFMAIYVLMMM